MTTLSPEAEAAEPSLEEQVREAFEATKEPEAAAEPAEDDATEIRETIERARDESGKFKAKDPEEAAAEPAEAVSEVEAPAEPPADDPYAAAPQYSPKDIKEEWATLPPKVRQAIHAREQESHQALTRFDEERNFGKAVKAVVAPYEPFIRSLGAEPTQAVKYLIEGDYALRTGSPEAKNQMFAKLALDYGIDLGQVTQHVQNAPPVNPEVETLKQQMARLQNQLDSGINATRETEQAHIDQSINAFASDPANVYFEQVKPVMAALLQNGQAADLKEAYDAAVYANPETRALRLAADRADEDRKRTAAAAAKADAARKASVSVTGAPGSAMPTPTSESSGSLEDDLRSAFRAASGRV